MDGKVLLQNKVFYYYAQETEVMINLFHLISEHNESNYSVLYGGKPNFSNVGELREVNHE